jgi:hypothetical protein
MSSNLAALIVSAGVGDDDVQLRAPSALVWKKCTGVSGRMPQRYSFMTASIVVTEVSSLATTVRMTLPGIDEMLRSPYATNSVRLLR